MSTRLSLAESKALLKAQKKPNKYRAQRTVVDGHAFDSKREAREYGRLAARQKAGKIEGLEIHPKFTLHAPNGELIGTYVADFRYLDDGYFVVVDVKGMKTLPLARWKQNHLRAEYGITVEERR